MFKKTYDILSETLLVLSIIATILLFAFPNNMFVKIKFFELLIIFFVSIISKKKVLSNQTPTIKSKVLMAVMMIVTTEFFFSVFFVLGRLFVRTVF